MRYYSMSTIQLTNLMSNVIRKNFIYCIKSVFRLNILKQTERILPSILYYCSRMGTHSYRHSVVVLRFLVCEFMQNDTSKLRRLLFTL